MTLTLEQALGQKLMLSFRGTTPSADFLATLQHQHVGGLTLFRSLNVESPAQVRALTAALQRAAADNGQPLLLIGVDQEGGQLMAIGDGPTPFPGNMALGATGSEDLARRVGYAIGLELAAMGININYAPVCDVNVNPANPVVGTRSFGEDATLVARLCAAKVEGLQAAGVAATAKHFPGHGDTATDSHYGTPTLLHDAARLREVEFPPFVAAVQAGARLVMTAHIALPALNQGLNLPATLSPAILHGILRGELGFQGVIISDALDMHAIEQGAGLGSAVVAASAAGVDMLMLTTYTDQAGIYTTLCHAAQQGLLSPEETFASTARILELKAWVATQPQPELAIVGCADHRALAHEIAARAVTLVHDSAARLPLRLAPDARLAVILPRPADLTPADTSSYIVPRLAHALRPHHAHVDEIIIPLDPSAAEIATLHEQARPYDLVIVGTINAYTHAGQAALVNALLDSGVPTIAVALRMPYDLQAFPRVPTYLCTYSIQPPAMDALAQALFGLSPFLGRLPVSIPDGKRLTG